MGCGTNHPLTHRTTRSAVVLFSRTEGSFRTEFTSQFRQIFHFRPPPRDFSSRSCLCYHLFSQRFFFTFQTLATPPVDVVVVATTHSTRQDSARHTTRRATLGGNFALLFGVWLTRAPARERVALLFRRTCAALTAERLLFVL